MDYAREALEQARQQFNEGKRSYALVPYHGASGTRRRPIYIECTSDRVILQPEGVELFSEDFREPLTDDNALASALRAQREYFADATRNRDDPPYPLIIVRPDGAHAYAAARAAMESWDAEFGYELVDEDMQLAFPEVDAALVDVVREAVDEARAPPAIAAVDCPRPLWPQPAAADRIAYRRLCFARWGRQGQRGLWRAGTGKRSSRSRRIALRRRTGGRP